ncbi:Gag protein, partial [Phytophthora palmivora]
MEEAIQITLQEEYSHRQARTPKPQCIDRRSAVRPSRTQLFRIHENAMEEAIQITLQEEYNHRQARTPTSVWQGHNASSGA